MFWRKKNTITLDCYTSRADIYNNFPIVEGKRTIPKWFKKLSPKKTFNEERFKLTIKTCPGFLDYYTNSISLPLWSDLDLRVSEKGRDFLEWQYADLTSTMDEHPPWQYEGLCEVEEYRQIKLVSPWRFVCSEKIKFLCTGPDWDFNKIKNIRILSGVVDFYHQNGTHINLIIEKQEQENTLRLEAGLPIYYFFPLTEKKVIIRNHLVSEEKINRISRAAAPFKFENSFAHVKKLRSSKNCPYKFDIEDE